MSVHAEFALVAARAREPDNERKNYRTRADYTTRKGSYVDNWAARSSRLIGSQRIVSPITNRGAEQESAIR